MNCCRAGISYHVNIPLREKTSNVRICASAKLEKLVASCLKVSALHTCQIKNLVYKFLYFPKQRREVKEEICSSVAIALGHPQKGKLWDLARLNVCGKHCIRG